MVRFVAFVRALWLKECLVLSLHGLFHIIAHIYNHANNKKVKRWSFIFLFFCIKISALRSRCKCTESCTSLLTQRLCYVLWTICKIWTSLNFGHVENLHRQLRSVVLKWGTWRHVCFMQNGFIRSLKRQSCVNLFVKADLSLLWTPCLLHSVQFQLYVPHCTVCVLLLLFLAGGQETKVVCTFLKLIVAQFVDKSLDESTCTDNRLAFLVLSAVVMARWKDVGGKRSHDNRTRATWINMWAFMWLFFSSGLRS